MLIQMFRISKRLEESFKLISFMSVRYLARASKFRTEYLNEYKKAIGKMNKQSKNDRNREKKKYIEENQRLRNELNRVKKKLKDRDGEYDDSPAKDRDRERERGKERDRERAR